MCFGATDLITHPTSLSDWMTNHAKRETNIIGFQAIIIAKNFQEPHQEAHPSFSCMINLEEDVSERV